MQNENKILGRGGVSECAEHHLKELGLLEDKTYTPDEVKDCIRLIPYLVDCTINGRRLDPNKMSVEEVMLMGIWTQKKFMDIDDQHLKITHEFWTKMCEALWWCGYCQYRIEPQQGK